MLFCGHGQSGNDPVYSLLRVSLSDCSLARPRAAAYDRLVRVAIAIVVLQPFVLFQVGLHCSHHGC